MADLRELKVDHDSLVPLHAQLQRQLRSLIGAWRRGAACHPKTSYSAT
jgi:hypothetical protein